MEVKGRRLGREMLVLAGLLLLGGEMAEAQGARDTYKSGVEAYEAGRLGEAESLFRKAIAERSEEKIGTFGGRYLPYSYLGLTLAGRGDCRGAQAAWESAEKQGQVQKVAEVIGLVRQKQSECRQRVEQAESAVSEAETALESAVQASSSLASLSRTPELKDLWESSFAPRQKQAAALLSEARQQLQTGEASLDVSALASARETAERATAAFQELTSEARGRLSAENEAITGALLALEEVETKLQAAVRSLTDLEPYPPQLAKRVEEAKAQLALVAENKTSGKPADLAELTAQTTTTLENLQGASRRPPSALVKAVEAFLAGDFPAVLDGLADKTYRDDRSTGHLCLLRAASRYSLYVLDGERDAERLEQARQDVAVCAALNPPPTPSDRFFSPRFLAFYRTTLGEVSPAAAAPAEGAR